MAYTQEMNNKYTLGNTINAYACITSPRDSKKEIKSKLTLGVKTEIDPIKYNECRPMLEVYTDETKEFKIKELTINLDVFQIPYDSGNVSYRKLYQAIHEVMLARGWVSDAEDFTEEEIAEREAFLESITDTQAQIILPE